MKRDLPQAPESTPPPPQNAPPAFAAFSDWAERFRKGELSASLSQGSALAWKRRESMLELLRTNPRQALHLAAPFRWRTTLPAGVTQFFEEQIDGRGALNVAVADRADSASKVYRQAIIGDRSFEAFVYGRRLGQRSQENIPLHGVALGGILALDESPLRRLSPEEAQALKQSGRRTAARVCFVCSKPAVPPEEQAAEIGEEIAYFCGNDHADAVSGHWIRQENRPRKSGSSSKLGEWTLGPKNLLYIRINFPDDLSEPIAETGAYNVMDSVNDFYAENSYDMTSVTTIVTPLLTMPKTKAWYSTAGPFALLGDARAAAFEAGYDTGFYDLDIVCHTAVPGFDWGGLGVLGGKGTWLQSAGTGVTAHELGHNYGLMHANFWDTSTDDHSGIGPGLNVEYGNLYDTMGQASAGRNHFNAFFKHDLQWLPNTAVASVTSSGVHRIHSFDVPFRIPGRSYTARIPRDFERDYWLEVRQQFDLDPWVGNGVLLNWSPWELSEGGTSLIDTTPGSPAQSLSRVDSALIVGRTFSDVPAGVHITPLRRGIEGTNTWMDIQVNLGAFPQNQPPVFRIEMDPGNPEPGSLIHFHAAATDPDGDALAYSWEFDDSTFSNHNLSWTYKTFSAAGDHVVRCTVSDMKDGFTSVNSLFTVGQSSGNRITGLIVDTNGVPIERVRVDNLADTNAPQTVVGYSDSSGRYAIVGVFNDINLSASKYGLTFTNLTWTNPITAGTSMLNTDFIATALPVITIAATTNEVFENSPALSSFVLKRTGDTATNLIVNVYLSGSATPARDYSLQPALETGANTLEFPPGADSVAVAFRALNDSLVEGRENITLTLRDDLAYVAGSAGFATITVLDDDATARPYVSVAAANKCIAENGMDGCEVVFTRTGSASGELLIYYGVSGTATPGVDYQTPSGVILIPEGQSSGRLQLTLIDDKDVELEETVLVTVIAHPAYGIGNASAQTTIVDDDSLTVTISATGAGAREPSGTGTFTVKRDGDLTPNLVVYYHVTGTTTSGLDYETLSGSVTIPARQASANIILRVRDDAEVEGDESVTLTLTNNAWYDVGTPASATLAIVDNEKPAVSISAADPESSEPGEDLGSFVISRGPVTNGILPVRLAISGTAINGVDYVPLDNLVVIPNGARQVTIDLIPFDDLHAEPVEAVQLLLVPSADYNLGSPMQARVFIADDDYNVPAVGFTFHSSSAAESDSPGISLSLSSTSAVPVTVFYRVIGGTATPGDYVPPPGPLTIDPGYTAKLLPLQIRNNSTLQADRTLRLALFDPAGATLDGIRLHTYTILDDDSASVSITATQPNASENGPAPGGFRITRNGNATSDLEVRIQVAGTASAPADYAPLGSAAVIPAGELFVDLPVHPVNDRTVEHPESVIVELINAPGATIVSPAVATVFISDDEQDFLPVVTVTSTNGPNAGEAGAPGEFSFFRSNTNGILTVYFSVAGTAVGGSDYLPLSGAVGFIDGQSSASLPVNIIDDSLLEGEETVLLALTTDESYRVLYPSGAMVTVHDNEQRVRLDASDFIAAEPGADAGDFTFTRFGSTNQDLRVSFTISGTALDGVDFAPVSNSFVIPAGQLSAVLPIQVIDDLEVEGPESLRLTLQSGTDYSLESPSEATLTINDDEPMLTLTASVPSVVESSQRPGVLTLTRTGDPGYEFTAYLAVGGTAAYGIDYPGFATNIYFACGVTEIDLPIFPSNELTVEGPELVNATLLPDPAYTILWPSNATVNIEDAGLNQRPVIVFNRPRSQPVNLHGPDVTLLVDALTDDDAGTNTLTNTWSQISGPDVAFGTANAPNTTITFSSGGFYVLRLTADDGQLQTFADLQVSVTGEELSATTQLLWLLDDGSGTIARDSSGSGRDGVLVGQPQWVTDGVFGGGIEFTGGNDHIRCTDTTNLLDGRKAFSLGLWFWSAVTNEDQAIFCANLQATNGTLALYTRRYATCGQGSNVIEATIRTTAGVARHVSQSNAVTNGWQHLLLTWQSGVGLSLYINGEPDRPLTRYSPIGGVLTNSPQFIVGKGPLEAPFSLRAKVDEVFLFPWAVNEYEAGAIGGGGCGGVCGGGGFGNGVNFGPVVDAGPDATVQINLGAELTGSVTDDNLPNPPAGVSNAWVLVSGPAPVAFTNFNALTNRVQFAATGTNVFRLVADDGDVATCDDVTIIVTEPTRVDIWASDFEGAELGPDTAEFTLMRAGDTQHDLSVFFAFTGIASNGLDFATISNAITFSAGSDTATIGITPRLDHRTEGDQDLTLTIVSNSAYTIGNGQATIIIHDSPYGMWTIGYFTLEELTDPGLSGETADFDHDGLINFVEYAANFDPKTVETNAPLVTTLETDPGGGPPRIRLTYHRRLPPTDVAYEPAVSYDLLAWQSGTNTVEELQAIDDGNGLTETVTARFRTPLSTTTNQFVTVRIWLLSTPP